MAVHLCSRVLTGDEFILHDGGVVNAWQSAAICSCSFRDRDSSFRFSAVSSSDCAPAVRSVFSRDSVRCCVQHDASVVQRLQGTAVPGDASEQQREHGHRDATGWLCRHTFCVITKLYDQTPNHNDLTPAPPGGAMHGLGPNGYDVPAIADALPLTVGGHRVYGVLVNPGTGYRNDAPKDTAVNGQPEGVYMVTSALHLNEKCCFDFGNAETNNLDNKAGHMDAVNIMCHGNPCKPDAGLDMEDGIYGHLAVPAGTVFVTDMGASDGQHSYAIYQGNAQSGGLTTTGVIPLPQGY